MITDRLEAMLRELECKCGGALGKCDPCRALEELKAVNHGIRDAVSWLESYCECDCQCDRNDDEHEVEHGVDCQECDYCSIAEILRGES